VRDDDLAGLDGADEAFGEKLEGDALNKKLFSKSFPIRFELWKRSYNFFAEHLLGFLTIADEYIPAEELQDMITLTNLFYWSPGPVNVFDENPCHQVLTRIINNLYTLFVLAYVQKAKTNLH
jgi:hypothetical protein